MCVYVCMGMGVRGTSVLLQAQQSQSPASHLFPASSRVGQQTSLPILHSLPQLEPPLCPRRLHTQALLSFLRSPRPPPHCPLPPCSGAPGPTHLPPLCLPICLHPDRSPSPGQPVCAQLLEPGRGLSAQGFPTCHPYTHSVEGMERCRGSPEATPKRGEWTGVRPLLSLATQGRSRGPYHVTWW